VDKGLLQSHQAEILAVGCIRQMDSLDQGLAAQLLGAARDPPTTQRVAVAWVMLDRRISPGAVLGNRACRESSCASATNAGSHSLTSAPFGAIRYITAAMRQGQVGELPVMTEARADHAIAWAGDPRGGSHVKNRPESCH